LMIVAGIVTFIVVLLILVLIPVSFSYIERQNMGFQKSTITNAVDKSKVYFSGQHFWGPGKTAVQFPTTWKLITFTEADDSALTVFTDVGEIQIEVAFYYRLDATLLSTLYTAFGLAYDQRVRSISQAQLRNAATLFTTADYQNNRTYVSKSMFLSLQSTLPNTAFVQVDPNYFFLGRIWLPKSVLNKRQQVFANTQLLTTQRYNFTASQTRLVTKANVTSINNQAYLILQNATQAADRMRKNAGADRFASVQKESGSQVVRMISNLGISKTNVTDHFLKFNALLDASNNLTLLSGLTSAIIGS
jgi:hypothetical protein